MALLKYVAVLLVCTAAAVHGANILMLLPVGGKSMKNIFYGMGNALSSRGHSVTFFNGFKPSTPVEGIREVVPEELAALFADKNFPNLFEVQKDGLHVAWTQFKTLFVEAPRVTLASKEFDDLLKEDFDVVIMGQFAYAFYAVPYLRKTPFIVLTGHSCMPFLTGPLGSPTLPALVPVPLTSSTDRMSFLERVQSVLGHVFVHLLFRAVYMPYCDRMVAARFGAGVIPPAAEIERNVSLVLQSSNPITDYHRPLLPNVVEVGGMHCVAPRPLPEPLREFLGGDAELIFFSLGSVVRPQDMSQAHRSAVLTALAAVPFKVLLKWDTADRAGVPANVLPSKWLPQQDILGDSRCRLFITHGGFASVLESRCHGVPMVTMPVSGDHTFNSKAAAAMGVAEILAWDELTSDTLLAAIGAALSADHRAAARYRRDLLASQPIHPRDLAVHWVEHVIRHRGAPHLRSVAADLYWFQYYSLDVLAFLLAVLVLVLKTVAALVGCCCRRICTRKASTVQIKTKRSKRD